ncbi:MAG TPA: TlpA disulfide reductase family protein [Sedimentisphaerales bacterium]|nr:TlpA disulfide reductase family protein [Sedimentisphaerales bacterium]
MNIYHYAKLFMIFVLLSSLNESVYAVSTNASNELLHCLIKKNSEARKKVSSSSYLVEFHSERETKNGKRIDHGHGLVKWKGNCRWSTFENNAQIPQKAWQQKQSGRIVLNDRYLAYWPSIGNPYAYRVDHNSIGMMTKQSQAHATFHSPPDYQLLNICYQGFEQTSFVEEMKLHPDQIRWEAVRKNDGNIREIKRFSPYMHDKSKPDAIWTIDGDKGFLVTERISFTRDGNISEHIKMEIKEILPKIWFPTALSKKRFDHKNNLKEIVDANQIVTLREIQLNIAIPEEQFEMEALGLPNDITIFWSDQNDESVAWVYEGVKLVRRSEFLKRQRIQKREEHKITQQSLLGNKAPSLQVENWVQGESITLDKLKGRYILLDFFGEWCVPCHKTYPLLVKEDNSRSSEDLFIIGIHTPGSNPKAIKSLLKKYGIKYSIVIDKLVEGKEYMGETFAAYLVKGIPHAVLLDRTGNIIAHGSVEEIIKVLERNLSSTEN